MAVAIRSIVRIMAADRLSVRITTAVLRETAVLRQSESSVQPARPVRWVREALREYRAFLALRDRQVGQEQRVHREFLELLA